MRTRERLWKERNVSLLVFILLSVTYTTQFGNKIKDEDSRNNILIYCSL